MKELWVRRNAKNRYCFQKRAGQTAKKPKLWVRKVDQTAITHKGKGKGGKGKGKKKGVNKKPFKKGKGKGGKGRFVRVRTVVCQT